MREYIQCINDINTLCILLSLLSNMDSSVLKMKDDEMHIEHIVNLDFVFKYLFKIIYHTKPTAKCTQRHKVSVFEGPLHFYSQYLLYPLKYIELKVNKYAKFYLNIFMYFFSFHTSPLY